VTSRIALTVAAAASAAAAAGWVRAPHAPPHSWVQIVDVRPLETSDPDLRDRITHTFAVRIATAAWTLLPYKPGVTAEDNRHGAGHWRLYLDGHALADNLGSELVSYVYLAPGLHWIAAELSNADSTSLQPSVWSEPVLLHVPKVIRCWQTGWRGSSETGIPRFRCRR
jgi:hypothetical protein